MNLDNFNFTKLEKHHGPDAYVGVYVSDNHITLSVSFAGGIGEDYAEVYYDESIPALMIETFAEKKPGYRKISRRSQNGGHVVRSIGVRNTLPKGRYLLSDKQGNRYLFVRGAEKE